MKIAVIGAGVFGLASAIELASRGHEVSVFERGVAPHPDASSTDVAKSIRRTWYAGDNETYVELVERAAAQWRTWERASGKRFYHQVGGLSIVSRLANDACRRRIPAQQGQPHRGHVCRREREKVSLVACQGR